MTPKVSLRQALEDPSLLCTALAGPSWHAWRSLLLATMGEPLNPEELDTKQAKVLLDYAEGTLESTPLMRQLLDSRTADTLTLTTGIALEVRSASFRRIRGVTCVAVLADECAFWLSDESANPDVEILNAARPALATTQGPLIAISSPYARRGASWEIYRKRFGPEGDPMILFAQGAGPAGIV